MFWESPILVANLWHGNILNAITNALKTVVSPLAVVSIRLPCNRNKARLKRWIAVEAILTPPGSDPVLKVLSEIHMRSSTAVAMAVLSTQQIFGANLRNVCPREFYIRAHRKTIIIVTVVTTKVWFSAIEPQHIRSRIRLTT